MGTSRGDVRIGRGLPIVSDLQTEQKSQIIINAFVTNSQGSTFGIARLPGLVKLEVGQVHFGSYLPNLAGKISP